MLQSQPIRENNGDRQADGDPQTRLHHRGRRIEVRADRLENAKDDAANPSGCRRRGWHRYLGPSASRDDGVAAERDRQIGNDPQGVVNVEPIKHLIGRAPGLELLARPAVEGGAMGEASILDGAKVWGRATGEHVGAGAQGGNGRRGQAITLGDPRHHRSAVLIKGTLHDVDDPLQLDQQLREGAVASRRSGRTLRRRDIFATRGLFGGASGIDPTLQLGGIAAGIERFNEVGHAPTCLRGLLA